MRTLRPAIILPLNFSSNQLHVNQVVEMCEKRVTSARIQVVPKQLNTIFIFAPCINSIKALFINPTDKHNYKIIGMLETIKIPTIAPTCFGSIRKHHQGAISCLAKTTIMVLLCSSLMTLSMSWRHISLRASMRCVCCALCERIRLHSAEHTHLTSHNMQP
jgi:hypothetical protein